jgi:hypothetical protein
MGAARFVCEIQRNAPNQPVRDFIRVFVRTGDYLAEKSVFSGTPISFVRGAPTPSKLREARLRAQMATPSRFAG